MKSMKFIKFWRLDCCEKPPTYKGYWASIRNACWHPTDFQYGLLSGNPHRFDYHGCILIFKQKTIKVGNCFRKRIKYSHGYNSEFKMFVGIVGRLRHIQWINFISDDPCPGI